MTLADYVLKTPGARLCHAVALALLALPHAALAELPNDTIGRLFLSPAERAKIEQTRGKEIAADITFGETDPGEAAKPSDEAVALNGLVRRADGNDIVWVNGQIIGDRLGSLAEIKVHKGPDANNNVVLESTGIPRPVRLKPGQAWDRTTNRAVDCYRCTALDNDTTSAMTDDSDSDE